MTLTEIGCAGFTPCASGAGFSTTCATGRRAPGCRRRRPRWGWCNGQEGQPEQRGHHHQ
ncbi:hypothetical protein GS462_26850 [Rhodococcus hoagii]|nr:hypothetical protein [Prescottella equi]